MNSGAKAVRAMSEFFSERKPAEALETFIVIQGTSVLQPYWQGMFGKCQIGSVIKKFLVVFQHEYHLPDLRASSLDAVIPSLYKNDIATVWVDPVEHREIAEMYKIVGLNDEGDARWRSLPSVLLIDVSGERGR